MKSAAQITRVLLVLLCTTAVGAAQQKTSDGPSNAATSASKGDGGGDVSLSQAQNTLRERNREALHPGEPLTIIGLEQGDNDLRSRTPALAGGEQVARRVDPVDDYARKLAMYDDGAVFHAPARSASSARESTPDGPAPAVRAKAAPPTQAKSQARSVAWAIGFGLCVGATLWWVQKRMRLAVWRAR